MRPSAALGLSIAFIALPAIGLAEPSLRVSLGAYSASGTNDAQVGYTAVDLGVIPVAQPFTVDTCDSPTGTTYLRIVDDAGEVVAAGSGGCPSGTGTSLSALAPATRRYQVRAGCGGNSDCSGRLTGSSVVKVVERWAPVLYQDTWPGNFFIPGDYVTNFNFDGDYDGSNNWEHADQATFPFKAHVYYSHVETRTHHFIGYYFFHPQDRSCDLNQHENDLEGILLAVKKVGLYGEVIAMETEAHGKLFQYVTQGLGTTESPTGTAPDGSIVILPDRTTNPRTGTTETMPVFMGGHPEVFSQSGGHGVFSCDNGGLDQVNCFDNDGVVYAWKGGASHDPQANECANGKQESLHFDLLDACGYRLVSLDDWGGSSTVADPAATQGFWVLQNHICEHCTFHSFTNFRGDGAEFDGACGAATICTCTDNSPNAPWQWRDHEGVGSGDWVGDPARLFDIDFEGPEFSGQVFSHEYTRHPYFTHRVQLGASRVTRATDLLGQPIDYAYVFVQSLPEQGNESNAITGYHWLKNSPAIGTWYPWSYGADDAAGENVWSRPGVDTYYFIRQTQDRLPDGTYQNGGRSVEVSLRHELTSVRLAPDGTPEVIVVEAPIVSKEIGPGDWSSGTCSAADDSGCVGANGAYDYCRVQTNDFTCGDGIASAAGDVTFKLTRIRRPSAPPVARAGADRTVECASPSGTTVVLDASGSSDPEGDPLTFSWRAPGVRFDDPTAVKPAGVFPLGSTQVTLTVSDGTSEVDDTVVVVVADTTPPSLVLRLSPDVLSPPLHQLVDVTAAVSASDACSAAPVVPLLKSITSNEPDDATGDGRTAPDIQGAGFGTFDTSYQLRAERAGSGTGRVYTVTYTATDGQGNSSGASGQVTVPR